MIKLPSGVDIKELINDLRMISWEAAEILLNYAEIIKFSNNKTKIIKNNNSLDPVTLADLKVNDLVIKRINRQQRIQNRKDQIEKLKSKSSSSNK